MHEVTATALVATEHETTLTSMAAIRAEIPVSLEADARIGTTVGLIDLTARVTDAIVVEATAI